MTSTVPPPTPWQSAADLCWSHVALATKVARLVDTLSHIDVATVTPILSTLSTSILLTPHAPADETSLRLLTLAISTALGTDKSWTVLTTGDNLVFRLSPPIYGIHIDVLSSIPSQRPVNFQL